MPPFIHGRIYPEATSSTLVRRELRILVDPRAITRETVRQLLDIDVLRHYLRDLPGQPCQITLLAPAQRAKEHEAEYEIIRQLGGEVLSVASILLPEVVEAFGNVGERCPEAMALVSTALAGDANIVVTLLLPEGVNLKEVYKRLYVSVEDWSAAKKSCEIFVRGHEVPWSFHDPAWGNTWTTFYSMAEPSVQLIELYERARRSGLDSDTLEDIRSLAYNRRNSLCYTRDKLLFYVQQRRAAKRHKLLRQDFSFEVGYFLNHYYVLFWAGLDQICWIVNGIFELGLTRKDWRKVGTLNLKFLKVLREKAPQVLELFEDAEFVRWVKMVRGARHFVAHRGIAALARLFLQPETELSDEELDREVEASDEWRQLERMFPRELVEYFRPTLKFQAKLRRYEEISEPVLRIEFDGEEALIHPLVNIEWDFDHFFDFAHKVAGVASHWLQTKQ